MNNRELRFRVWDGIDYMSTPFTLKDLQEKKVMYASNTVVMQYTGLKDKNGKEIYEGDVIKDYNATEPEDNGFIVLWEGFGWKIKLNDSVYQYVFELTETYSTLEIIGNIYQNPELLNK